MQIHLFNLNYILFVLRTFIFVSIALCLIIIGIEYLFEFKYDLISSSYDQILTQINIDQFLSRNSYSKNLNLTILMEDDDNQTSIFDNTTINFNKKPTHLINNATKMYSLTTIYTKNESSFVYF